MSTPSKSGQPVRLPRIDSLQPLRYGAELMIIGYHFYTKTENEDVNNFNFWGNIGLTFFFLLSGFILAYQYSKREEKIDTVTFFLKRFAGLYPLYFLALSLGFVLHQNQLPRPWALAMTLFLCISNWVPSGRLNLINTPAWTVGAFLVLYALFPYCLRLLKSLNPKFRTYFLPPLLYLASLVTPMLELGLNTGILHPIAQMCSSICLPSFLLGMNLALNYLDQDWDRHPMLFQRFGASASILVIAVFPWFFDARAMPSWAYLWKDMGLASPVFCVLIYYAARQKDHICWLLQQKPLVFVGNCSYGMYLFQAFCWDVMQAGNTYFYQHHYQRASAFVAFLTGVACFTVKWVQQVYTPVLYDYLVSLLKHYDLRARCARLAGWVLPVLHSRLVCEVASVAFFSFYVFFVNNQPCAFPSCRFDPNKKLWVSWELDHRRWFMADDYRRMLAFWSLPCQPRASAPAFFVGLARLGMVVGSMVALPAALCQLRAVFAPSPKTSQLADHKAKHIGELELRPPAPPAASDLCPPLKSVPPVIVRLLFPASFPTRHSGAALSRTYELLCAYRKRLGASSPHFTLESIGLHPGSFKGKCPTPDPDSVRLVVRHDPRRRFLDLPDLLQAGHDGQLGLESGSCPVIIYLPAYCRLTTVGLERLIQQAETLTRYRAVGVLPCELDGTDEVVPSGFTLLSLNPCGPRARLGLFPAVAVTNATLDPIVGPAAPPATAPLGKPNKLSSSSSHIDDAAEQLATALSTAQLPSTFYFHVSPSPVRLASADPLASAMPVFPAYATAPSFTYSLHLRTRMVTGQQRGLTLSREVVLAMSEVALHAAFVLSFWLLCNTDIHLHRHTLTWGEARDKWGSCFGAILSGISPYRYYAAVVAGFYTSAWFSVFVRVFSPGDGPVRYVVLFSCFLLLLPLAAVYEAALIVTSLGGVSRHIRTLWHTGLGVVKGLDSAMGSNGGSYGAGVVGGPVKKQPMGVEGEEQEAHTPLVGTTTTKSI